MYVKYKNIYTATQYIDKKYVQSIFISGTEILLSFSKNF